MIFTTEYPSEVVERIATRYPYLVLVTKRTTVKGRTVDHSVFQPKRYETLEECLAYIEDRKRMGLLEMGFDFEVVKQVA